MSMSWSNNLPTLPTTPEPAAPLCRYGDWERLGPGESWLEYRRVVTLGKRWREEDAETIASLKGQLDRAISANRWLLNERGETRPEFARELLETTPRAAMPGTQRRARKAARGVRGLLPVLQALGVVLACIGLWVLFGLALWILCPGGPR